MKLYLATLAGANASGGQQSDSVNGSTAQAGDVLLSAIVLTTGSTQNIGTDVTTWFDSTVVAGPALTQTFGNLQGATVLLLMQGGSDLSGDCTLSNISFR